jgi:gamma-resorcylate decarboxylase
MSVPRTSNKTIAVRRLEGKIAFEEAVNSPYFDGSPAKPEVAADIVQKLDDVDKRLESMDASGVQYAIISLTAPGIEGVLDPDTAVYLAQKTNNTIYEKYVKVYPRRFGFFARVPIQKPELAAAELERAVTQLGAKGVLINGSSNLSKYLDEPAWEPFWAMLDKLHVPLYIHPRSPPPGQQRLFHGYPTLGQAVLAFGSR